MRKARKLDRLRSRSCGPVVDLLEIEWREKGKYQPPIRWPNLGAVIVGSTILYWLAAWSAVLQHKFEPGRLWFIYPTEWNWSYLATLL